MERLNPKLTKRSSVPIIPTNNIGITNGDDSQTTTTRSGIVNATYI